MVCRLLCQIARNAKFTTFRHGIRGYSRPLRRQSGIPKNRKTGYTALTFQSLSKGLFEKEQCLFRDLPSSNYCDKPCDDYKYPFGEQKVPEDVPLKPLKQKYVPKDPPKECPGDEESTIRADDACQASTKPLPSFTCEFYTPCNEKLPETPPLERLKPRELPEVRNVCNPPPPDECPSRADDNLKLCKRKLPKLEASALPKVQAYNYAPKPLKRLPKLVMAEPPRLCTESTVQCDHRADYNIRVGKKRLPMIKFDFVPETKAVPPPCPKLNRLPNLEPCEEPVKPAVEPPEPCPVRCDDVTKTDPPKPLPTVILKEENNFVSSREYNEKRERSSFNFTIKRKFSLMAIVTNPWAVSFLTVNALALNYYSKINTLDDEKLVQVTNCETSKVEVIPAEDDLQPPSIGRIQPARSNSLPYFVPNNEMLAPNERLSTVTRRFASSNSKKCNKSCVKIKIPGVSARHRETCETPRVEKNCKKTKCPYPSFAESVKDLEHSVCECPELPKLLQPKNEMIPEIKLLEPVSPNWAPIDVDVEAKCVKEKLHIKPGGTRTCENFHCPPRRITVKNSEAEKCIPRKSEERRKIASEPCPKPKAPNPWKKCYASWAAAEGARCASTRPTVDDSGTFWQSLCGFFNREEKPAVDALIRSRVPPPTFKCRKSGKCDDRSRTRRVAKKVQKFNKNPYTSIFECEEESLIILPMGPPRVLETTSTPLRTVALRKTPFPSFSESGLQVSAKICRCAKCERSFSTLRGALENFSEGGSGISYEDLPLDLFSPGVDADEEEEIRVSESFGRFYNREGGYRVDEFNELQEVFNAIEGEDE